MSVPSFAVEVAEKVETDNVQQRERTVILPDIVEDGGTVIPLFTLSINHVENLLTTSNSADKYIVKSELPSEATSLYVKGRITHSVTESILEDLFRTGLCYYIWETGMFYPEYSAYPQSGIDFVIRLVSIKDLDRNKKYYGYVKNLAGAGYVTGESIICYV